MVDRRAWIVTVLILLSMAGAYVLWFTRPRAGYNARSLSASGHPASSPQQPATVNLHVEGCREDFLVKPGEIVEPRVVPGAPLEQFVNVYGPETKPKRPRRGEPEPLIPGVHTWDHDEYTLAEDASSDNSPAVVHVSLKSRHVLQTLDDVELGIDSMGTVFRKMRDRMIEVRETIEHANGQWTLHIYIPSTCGRGFRSEYTRALPEDPEIDRQIAGLAQKPNGSPAGASALRSDIFMNKVVYEYTLARMNGLNAPLPGIPSEHN